MAKKKNKELTENERIATIYTEQFRILGCKIKLLEDEIDFIKSQLGNSFPYIKYTHKEYNEMLVKSKQKKTTNKGHKGC